MELFIKLLFFYAGASFLTWWFLKGLLNPFIEAVVGIVITGLFVVLSFFLSPFIRVARMIYRFILRILAPVWVKIPVYTLLGAGIFVLDHFYGTTIYAEDETVFYSIVFWGTKYWITQQGLTIGGFFLGLAVLYLTGVILKFINWLIDHPIHISILLYK